MAVQDGPPAEAVAPARPLPVVDRFPPVAVLLCGIVSIQFGAALAATLFDDLGPAGTSVLRLGFAAADPRALRLVALFGLALGLMNLTFYEAVDRIPLGVAVTVEFAGPLGVAVVLSRRRLDLVWAALAALGIVLLTNPFGESIDGVGLAFALGAAACWAAYILLAQRAGRHFSGSDGVALAMVVAALVPLVPGVVQGGADLLRPELLAIGAGIALLSSVIPYSLETEALRRLPTHVFGVLMSLEPAVAAVAGLLVLGQDLVARQIAAIGLVVLASVGVSRTAVPPPEA